MTHDLKLKKWNNIHAIFLLIAGTSFFIWAEPVVLLVVSACSFLYINLNFLNSISFSSSKYGWANLLTGLRLILILIVLFKQADFTNFEIVSILAICLAFDYVDGIIARKTKNTSDFGALFDMETDAFYVLATSCLLIQKALVPDWIIIIGLLRYLHVIGRMIFPKIVNDDKKDRFASWVAGILFVALILPFLFREPWACYVLLFSSVLVFISFIKSWL